MSDVLTKEEQIEQAWAQHVARRWPPASSLSAALRERLAEAQNWRCCWCGIRMEGLGIAWDAPTFEHIVPTSKGGGHEIDNLVIACPALQRGPRQRRSAMKLCKDCRWVRLRDDPFRAQCGHPQAAYTSLDPVDGSAKKMRFSCELFRLSGTHCCGPDAKLFEPKEGSGGVGFV